MTTWTVDPDNAPTFIGVGPGDGRARVTDSPLIVEMLDHLYSPDPEERSVGVANAALLEVGHPPVYRYNPNGPSGWRLNIRMGSVTPTTHRAGMLGGLAAYGPHAMTTCAGCLADAEAVSVATGVKQHTDLCSPVREALYRNCERWS